MLKKLYEKFKRGIEKIKWFASLFSERLKIEISVIRLLYRSNEMNRKRDELLKTIGQRVFDLKGHSENNVLKDSVIVEATAEIEKLVNDMEELKQKASDISSVAN